MHHGLRGVGPIDPRRLLAPHSSASSARGPGVEPARGPERRAHQLRSRGRFSRPRVPQRCARQSSASERDAALDAGPWRFWQTAPILYSIARNLSEMASGSFPDPRIEEALLSEAGRLHMVVEWGVSDCPSQHASSGVVVAVFAAKRSALIFR
ncbi:hypothetical protein NDU88_001664 [Pleurodeles waltl]|uniref:Uncharacterized protein n=1 Tax=Pleurodeles waltl TaxID=8319 RepID=A0AAV7U733_PLEWA|nr:hypothetical protein NDU88_001664 [Pleurodeles waltl]